MSAPGPEAGIHTLRLCAERLRSFHASLLAGGGGQDPAGRILPRFLELAGGSAARVAVVPVATRVEENREHYDGLFRRLGAAEVWRVDPDESQANDPAVVPALGHSSGICLAGGDQKRLVSILRGTLTARCLLDGLREGRPLYTTSAGTVALSDPMVAGLNLDDSLRIGPGLGILPGITIETHVNTRRRHHRLEVLAEQGISPLVVGIDEDTGLLFEPRTCRAQVIGVGEVWALRGPEAEMVRLYRSGETFDLAEFCG